MNGWDLFTWIMAAVLGVGAVLVFGFFLRDLRGLLRDLSDTSGR